MIENEYQLKNYVICHLLYQCGFFLMNNIIMFFLNEYDILYIRFIRLYILNIASLTCDKW